MCDVIKIKRLYITEKIPRNELMEDEYFTSLEGLKRVLPKPTLKQFMACFYKTFF